MVSDTSTEFRRFFVVGTMAVIVDFCSYYILLHFFNSNLSKSTSFMLGTFIAYFFNKYWTFQKKKRSLLELIKFIVLYCCTLQINIWINYFCLQITKNIFIAFISATTMSMILNFIGQKYWIFRNQKENM